MYHKSSCPRLNPNIDDKQKKSFHIRLKKLTKLDLSKNLARPLAFHYEQLTPCKKKQKQLSGATESSGTINLLLRRGSKMQNKRKQIRIRDPVLTKYENYQ